MLNHSVYRLGTSTAAFDAEISLTPSYACQDDLISPPTSHSGHLSTVNYSRPGAHGLPSYSWRQVHASNPVSAQPYTSRKRTAVPPPEDGPLPHFLVHEIQESTRALVHALRTQESHRAVVQSTTEQVPVISKSGPMLMQHSTTEEIEDSVFHALLVVQHRATMILLQRHRRVVLIRYWIRWMSIWHHRAHERFRMQIREKTAADADLLAAVAKEKQLNTTLQRQVAENEQELHLAREKLAAQRNVHDEDLAREIAIWRECLNEASRAHERGQTALEGELEEAKTRRREVEELLRLETRQKNSVEEKLHRMEQLCKRSEEELNDLTASHQFLKDNLSKKDRHCRGLEEELAETKVLCRRYQLERDEEANRRTQIEAALNQHRNTATAPSMHHEKSRKSHGDFSLSIPSMDRSLDPRAVANVLQRTVDVTRRARVWAAWWCWIEVRRGVHRQNQAEKIQSIKRKEALDQALAAQEKAEKDTKETTNTLQRMMYEKSMVQNSVSELVTLMSLHMDEVMKM